MTYVFGREVTVKLPEPRELPGGKRIAFSGTDVYLEMNKTKPFYFELDQTLRRSNMREVALILLAAEDYAEAGDSSVYACVIGHWSSYQATRAEQANGENSD